MLRKHILFFALLFFTSGIFAQSIVTGTIKDTSSNASVKNAVVALLTPKDSVLQSFTRVKEDGSFSLNVPPGKYILSVTHPVFADFIDDIEITKSEKLSSISLTPKSKLLAAVIVKSGSPIRLRGDTTIYTADSFKVSANANVEELLKKMPGIQVDKNGQIKAMGQTVEKVLVDGEEFFGDDPGMAVKNLRADAVKEVQVFDKKSDQSEFTGIDDGKTKKTINLKLKEDKKKGYFGKIDLAGGLKKNIDDRYNSNILLSSFKGKRKLSGFFLTGNTGQSGLSWEDEQKYGGSNDNFTMSVDDESGNIMWRGGASDDEPYLDPQNGYMTNVNAGVQYSNKWNDKTNLNFSPKYNSQRYNNHNETYTKTQSADTSFNRFSEGYSYINRNNIKVRGIYDVKLDSANSLKLTLNTNFYQTESIEASKNYSTGESGNILNSSDRNNRYNNDKEAFSSNIIFKHKFKKARRTLSFTADASNLNTKGLSFLKSSNTDFINSFSQNVDQMKDFDKTTNNVSSKITYTEPLGKKYAMQIGYQLNLNYGTNNQVTYRYTNSSAKYDTPVDSLTNHFRQNIFQHIPSATINYNYKKLKVNAGAGISLTDFELQDITVAKTYARNYTNFYPNANLTYSYKSNHNLQINYTGITRQPTIDQLQPLTKNEDIFNQYLGNPDLKPSFTNNLNINHNAYNFIKDIWMYQSLYVSFVQNSITNRREYFSNGKIISQPVNTNGNMTLGFYGGGGFKIKKINTRINLNTNGGYNKYAELINNTKIYSSNTNAGIGVNISKSKEKKYEVELGHNITYNVQATSQNDNKLSYAVNTFKADATVYYKKVWSLETEYEMLARQHTAEVPALTTNILNATLERTFRKDEYTFYFTVKDIFNENIGFRRSFYNNTFSEIRNDRLQRYFLLGLRWDFKNKAAKTK